jgi:phage/plasmid-like protein (TIGR03299 family)
MTAIDTAAPAVTPADRRRLMGSAYDLSGATSADEARVLAGLDWEPMHRPLFVDLPAADGTDVGDLALVEKERAVVRSDNGEMFGVVGREHKLLTNADFFDFADVLLGQADTTWADSRPFGGSLGGGKQPFLAFRLGEGVQVAGIDAVDTHVLLSNGHVGNTAFVITVLPIRMKCSNVVTAALRAGRKGQNLFTYSVQHSGDLTSKIAEAQAALNMTSEYMREFAAIADRLVDIDFSVSDFGDFVAELIPVADDAGDRARKTAEERRAAFRLNWNTPTLTDDLRATAWGALNIVTEVVDHGSLDVRKSKVPAAERRLQSVHFGTGAALRNRAYSLLGV